MKNVLALIIIFSMLHTQAYARSPQNQVFLSEYEFSDDLDSIDFDQQLVMLESMSVEEKLAMIDRRIDRLAKKLPSEIELPKIQVLSIFETLPVEGHISFEYLGRGIQNKKTGEVLRTACLEYDGARCLLVQDVLQGLNGELSFGAQSSIEYVNVSKKDFVSALAFSGPSLS